MIRTTTAIRTTTGLIALAALLTGCGNDDAVSVNGTSSKSAAMYDSGQDSASPSQSIPSDSATTPATAKPNGGKMDASAFAKVTGACSAQPQLTVKVGASPATALVTEDICPGSGAVVAPGATVTAHYTGIGLATGKVFDSSWARGKPIQFPLTGVIQGWSEGVPGMHVGGRRLLVVPGAMAYGPNPPTPDIQPNETLVFVVDIVSSP